MSATAQNRAGPFSSRQLGLNTLRLKRGIGVGATIVVLIGGGCGSSGKLGAKALSQQSKALQSEAAEGALLAQDAATGSTTSTYTREQSSVLAAAATHVERTLKTAKTAPALESSVRQLAILAGQVGVDLHRLSGASRDEARALVRELQDAARSSENIGDGLK